MLGPILGAVGGIASAILGDKQAKRQEANQREFAQQGIRWKVADAKAAGIHPLYALGANTATYSPVTVGTDLASVGQNLGRAMDATRTGTERIDAYSKTVQELQLKRMGLENELLASQIANIRQAGGNPPFPGATTLIEGQAQSGPVSDGPLKRTGMSPAQPQSESGAISDVGYARTKTGFAPVPSKDVKERIEDNLIQEVMWSLRNNVLPSLGSNQSPPPVKLPDGTTWWFNPARQEYQKARKVSGRKSGFWPRAPWNY